MGKRTPENDPVRKVRLLLDEPSVQATLDQMARDLLPLVSDPQKFLVMGMASRGVPLGQALAARLGAHFGTEIGFGVLDATFYRDDFHFRKRLANPVMRIRSMPRSVDDMDILLVDDVLYTGRTVRAAMEALMDLGRAHSIRLAVLVDRGHRQLPICPDAVGLRVETQAHQEVRVYVPPEDDETCVWLVEVPSP